MTPEQITTILSLTVGIFAVIAAIINGIRGYFFSNEYKESTESRLKEKDEHIKTLEYFSSPHFREAYDSMKAMHEIRIGQLNDEVDELNQEVESLTEQLFGEKVRRTQLELELAGMKISQKARSVIHAYTEGSRVAIEQIEDTVDVLSNVGKNIQRRADEISQVSVWEINPIPTESITVSDIAKVEITGPDNGETEIDNIDEVEPDDSELEKP